MLIFAASVSGCFGSAANNRDSEFGTFSCITAAKADLDDK
jgi:hypothetical protein